LVTTLLNVLSEAIPISISGVVGIEVNGLPANDIGVISTLE